MLVAFVVGGEVFLESALVGRKNIQRLGGTAPILPPLLLSKACNLGGKMAEVRQKGSWSEELTFRSGTGLVRTRSSWNGY